MKLRVSRILRSVMYCFTNLFNQFSVINLLKAEIIKSFVFLLGLRKFVTAYILLYIALHHCVKNVHIRSFYRPYFPVPYFPYRPFISPYSVRIRCIYLFIYLFILFIYLYIYLFILFIYIFIYLFIHLFIYLFIYLFIDLLPKNNNKE